MPSFAPNVVTAWWRNRHVCSISYFRSHLRGSRQCGFCCNWGSSRLRDLSTASLVFALVVRDRRRPVLEPQKNPQGLSDLDP